jgi:aminoglycoside phosphotransferase (APT) family kinase protein
MQRNEFNALHMIRQHTCIPTPIPLDVVVMPEDTDDTFDDSSDEPASWLLTTRVPGIPLWRCIYFLSDSNLAEITEQLKDYITQLRAIPKIINPEMAISNTLGEACQDHRLHMREPLGPFVNEEAFNQVVAFSDDPSRRGHQIFFTHADINPRNILVAQMDQPDGSKRWRISGLIDWETAGYYPEYWEYSKSMFEQFRWPDRYNNMIIDVFKEFGDYSRELETEMNSWGSWDT